MSEVTNEPIYEILKSLQNRSANLELVALEHSQALNAVRGHVTSIQTDSNNIYGVLTRIDQRLDRIERRLELRAFAEQPQKPYETP